MHTNGIRKMNYPLNREVNHENHFIQRKGRIYPDEDPEDEVALDTGWLHLEWIECKKELRSNTGNEQNWQQTQIHVCISQYMMHIPKYIC